MKRYILMVTLVIIHCFCMGAVAPISLADNAGSDAEIVPIIEADGQAIAETVSSTTAVSIAVGLSTGNQSGKTADWWVVLGSPDGLYSWTGSGWAEGFKSVTSYPLFDFSAIDIFSTTLPVGCYTFYFGVDTQADAKLNSPFYYDRVMVHVSDMSSGAYMQSGGEEVYGNKTFSTANTDESGVKVSAAGTLALSNVTVTTSGNTTNNDSSSFYGLNAAVLSESASTIKLEDCSVKSTGSGANGVFATGSGSSASLKNVTIEATGDGGHGVMATQGGTMSLNDVIINTTGAHGAAISTDRGGGTISVVGGNAVSSGQDSPGIYSTGTITATDAVIAGAGSEGAVIEGGNTITLTNTRLSGVKGTRDRGVLIYQSMSGDATGTRGTFTMTGGSFTWPSTSGPAFYVTNATGVITLKDVVVVNSSGTLVKAAADQWGNSGSNGGTVIFTSDGETLIGDLVADKTSSMTAAFQNASSLTGAINSANTASSVTLTLDESSIWTVTADSYLTILVDTAGISGETVTNIIGNGYFVYYDASRSENSALGGKTYSLNGGGYLTPKT